MNKKPKRVHEEVEEHETHLKVNKATPGMLGKLAERDIKQHKKVMSEDKQKYWQKRSLEKLVTAIRAGNTEVEEAKEFLAHAGMLDKKTIALFNNVKRAYNLLADRIARLV